MVGSSHQLVGLDFVVVVLRISPTLAQTEIKSELIDLIVEILSSSQHNATLFNLALQLASFYVNESRVSNCCINLVTSPQSVPFNQSFLTDFFIGFVGNMSDSQSVEALLNTLITESKGESNFDVGFHIANIILTITNKPYSESIFRNLINHCQMYATDPRSSIIALIALGYVGQKIDIFNVVINQINILGTVFDYYAKNSKLHEIRSTLSFVIGSISCSATDRAFKFFKDSLNSESSLVASAHFVSPIICFIRWTLSTSQHSTNLNRTTFSRDFLFGD
ncbi:hypothetical protein GEMRC1_004098 [Eukaryota sp. GEM-RC1]